MPVEGRDPVKVVRPAGWPAHFVTLSLAAPAGAGKTAGGESRPLSRACRARAGVCAGRPRPVGF